MTGVQTCALPIYVLGFVIALAAGVAVAAVAVLALKSTARTSDAALETV